LNPKEILDYQDSNFQLRENAYNIIFAVNGYQPIKNYMKALKPYGKLLVVGGDFRQLNETMTKGIFYQVFKRKKAISVMSKSSQSTLREIKILVENHHLKPLIGKIYPIAEVRNAYIDFEKGIHKGKIILMMNDK